jgi:hypothetical protein
MPTEQRDLFADLALQESNVWTQRRLARRPTRYRIIREEGRTVLKAESYGGNSAILREVHFPAERVGEIQWRWRVAGPLVENRNEREKRGDDFAARVFVIFDARDGPWSGKALCYVWSANQPVGATYRSPYSDDVAMIVAESGTRRAGQWVSVRRDVSSDFRRAFQSDPDSLTAIAFMVDTDNTRTEATAWFDRLVVELERPTGQ